MPIMKSELAQGFATGRTKTTGSSGITYTRVFKVLLSSPNEAWDIQATCGVHIGDYYPSDNRVTATSFQDRADGDSRVVRLVTFEYSDKAEAGDSSAENSPQFLPPDVRMANWSTSVSLMEVACLMSSKQTSPGTWTTDATPTNPNGSLYEGMTRLEPVMTVTVEQWEACTPTRHMDHVGKINSVDIVFPPGQPSSCSVTPMTMKPHTLMFQGLSHKASVESFGNMTYRGWAATYTFNFRKNPASINGGPYDGAFFGLAGRSQYTENIGWDMAVPQVGRDIKNIGKGIAEVDQGALHYNISDTGKILPDWANRSLVNENMILPALLLLSCPGGGSTQRVAASPVALNDNGSPRARDIQCPVIVYRHRVHEEADLVAVLGLRLT